jgi:hypothetical protein
MMQPGSNKFTRALRLQPHHHSGRRLPRHHTSYAAMTFMMLVTGVLLIGVSLSSEAATSGGNISYPAPKIPATITSPAAGVVLSSQPVLVRGVCEPAMVVEIDAGGKNSGSAQCNPDGNFELNIALISGANTLQARTFSLDGLEGPASGPVSISLKGNSPIILSSSSLRLSPKAGQSVSWGLEIKGGQAPYAIRIDWGDGSTSVVSQSAAGNFSPQHTYHSAGAYTVRAAAKDAAGHAGYLQELSLTNSYAASPKVKPAGLPNLALAWPIYVAAGLMLLSFWLGEKFEDEQASARRSEGDGAMLRLSS